MNFNLQEMKEWVVSHKRDITLVMVGVLIGMILF